MLATWKRLMTVIKSIEKKETKDGTEKWQTSVFHTMFLQIGLLLFKNAEFDKDCLEVRSSGIIYCFLDSREESKHDNTFKI